MRRFWMRAAVIAYVLFDFSTPTTFGVFQADAQSAPPNQPIPGDAYSYQHQDAPAQDIMIVDPMSINRAQINARGELSVTVPRAPGMKGISGAATIGASSVMLIPQAGEGRRLLAIKNESATATIAVCFGSCTAATNTAGNWTVLPGQSIVWNTPQAVPSDQVNIIASASSTPVTVQAW